jgi:long-subunit fatty acid transport protein
MKYIVLTILVIVINVSGFSAFEQNEAGTKPYALGGAFVALADNAWAIFYNPAGIARLVHPEISIFYMPQQFGLKELSTTSIAGNYNSNVGALGFGVRRFGFSLYKEITASFTYASMFLGVYAGVNLNYHSLTISNYGNDAAIGVDAGFIFPLVRGLDFGICVKNLNMPTIGRGREKLPQIFSTGVSYSPLDNLIVAADYRKEISFEGSPRFGVEYRVFDFASLRIGAANNPPTYTAGIGVAYEFIQFDYSFFTHQELGISHTFSVTLIWGGIK